MSNKNNINVDHYKTRGRGRQGDGVVYDDYKQLRNQIAVASTGTTNPFHAIQQAGDGVNSAAKFKRLQKLKRTRRRRGLSAKQLMERKLNLRRHTTNAKQNRYDHELEVT